MGVPKHVCIPSCLLYFHPSHRLQVLVSVSDMSLDYWCVFILAISPWFIKCEEAFFVFQILETNDKNKAYNNNINYVNTPSLSKNFINIIAKHKIYL